MELGFIGLGNMGLPLTQNLAKAGHIVHVYDISKQACTNAQNIEGVRVEETTADVSEKSKILFTCLPNDNIVSETYLGEEGILEGAQAGLITCDCSTVSPETSVLIQQSMATHQISHMDTTMLGSTPQAERGEVFFMIGGNKESVPALEVVFPAIAGKWVYVGASGSANRMKLIHNYLAAANGAVAAEVLAACIECGVSPEIFRQVVTQGGGMAHTTFFARRVERALEGEYSPLFALELMQKDARLAYELANSVSAPASVLAKTLGIYNESCEKGLGKEDFSAVIRLAKMGINKPICK